MRQTSGRSPSTAPASAVYRPAEQPRPALGLRALRGFSGVLAGGLVALAVLVAVAQWLVGSSGRPGPGTAVVVGHGSAALAAVLLQLVADRSRGLRMALAALAILVLAAVVLWFGWYA